VATAASDVAGAHDDAYQALSIARGIESRIGIIDALECLGGLARLAEEQLKAVRLLGAAGALRQAISYQRFLLHQARYDATVAELRTALGDEAFARAWAEGTALSLDEAVNYALRGRGERSRPPVGWLSLTPAEQDVARQVAEGRPNKDIADRLFISPRTVQAHLTHIYGKLGITSRVQLAQQTARHV
jgi:DNA-binding CsgD family transcriptional regulator